MKLYNRFVLPRLLDYVMHREAIAQQRQILLKAAQGNVLEIGFGTGANLPHYPSAVQTLQVVEPEQMLPDRVAQRIGQRGLPVQWHQLRGEALPFEEHYFDTVVSTFTLCSVQDPAQVLREVRRVLKTKGTFLTLEHGLSPDPAIARWQNRFNGLMNCCGGGCNLNRPMRSLLTEAGFHIQTVEEFYLPALPAIGGYLTRAKLQP
ncbi:class I SAM-dependent methyltransferase [Synechococcus moorigangaii CMS01]|nr:class I SAM-dependent methyltransferase [Synechococcus moorigangaii CMS01]